MKTPLTSIFTALSLLCVNNAHSSEPDYNYIFDTGSAIIYCASPSEDAVLPVEVINEAFPK